MSDVNLFVVLYTGNTVNSARVVAASTDSHLVQHAAEVMLASQRQDVSADELAEAIRQGRVAALSFATGAAR